MNIIIITIIIIINIIIIMLLLLLLLLFLLLLLLVPGHNYEIRRQTNIISNLPHCLLPPNLVAW